MSRLIAVPGTGTLIDTQKNNYIFNIQSKDILDRIKDNIPHYVARPYDKGTLVAMPVHDDTIQMLNNIGLSTNGIEPMRWDYKFPLVEGKHNVMEHQVSLAAFMASHPRSYNLASMRLGKTASTVMCTDYLQRTGRIKGAVLIIATVSTLRGAWGNTIESTLPDKICRIVHGGTGKEARLKVLRQYADYYVINYDGVKMVSDELVKMVEAGRIDCVVVDELTHYGNPKSQRFKALDAVVNGKHRVKYVYGLTGTPGDDPIPIYGMCKLINPDRMPCKYITAWRDMTQYHFGRESWQWRNKPECAKLIKNTMQPAIRFDKKDILNLPPIVKQVRECELTSEQAKAYKQMKEEMLALVDSGEVIEAVHKASLSQKLFQIALGSAIIKGKDKPVELDNTPRIKLLDEIIKETPGKTVIFCSYTGVIHRTAKQLRELGHTVEIVDGGVTGKRREEIFSDFQNKPNPKVLLAHQQTTAFGVELAAADTMIFNGPPLSGGFIYEQALERLSSIKQKADQIYIVQLAATDAELKFFKGLDMGVKASELINDMFLEETTL